jgi:hypothetical protein
MILTEKAPLPVGAMNAPLNGRERLRFVDFAIARTRSGACEVEVALQWPGGERIVGRATGPSSPMGDLRIAADAAIRALEEFTGGQSGFTLAGFKVVRAFDANLVVVSVGHGTQPRGRVIGCYLAEADLPKAAALAVLNATNRILGNYVATQ